MLDVIKVLIVEDSLTQAMQLQYILEQHDCAVVVAKNGKKALQMIAPEKPSLVISDIVMPEMDGYELCKAIKHDPATRDIPVILLTSLSNPHDIIRGLECGANSFIVKPYNEDILFSRISDVLSNRHLGGSAFLQNIGIEIFFDGQRYNITSDRVQIISLLLSSYDTAVQKNQELIEAKQQVEASNKLLEKQNQELIGLNEAINAEKEKSDRLLLNILPRVTAEELKEKGSATPRSYELTTIMFTDFKDFTRVAEQLRPEELIQELSQCFFAFDEIIERYELEKIKTIGDAYMCAGGIPVPNATHPMDVVAAGLAMQQWMSIHNDERAARGEPTWGLRIGIHTGPLVAGVIGKKKFVYDIWGDAVNVASRMESSGEAGKVNISGNTYALVKDYFDCEFRGQIYAKNKGNVDMYFVHVQKAGDEDLWRTPNWQEKNNDGA